MSPVTRVAINVKRGIFVLTGLSLDRDQGTSREGTVERYLQKQYPLYAKNVLLYI